MQLFRPQTKIKGIFSIILIALFFGMGNSDEINEDCIVKQSFRRQTTPMDEFAWMAFLTNETDVTIFVAFLDRTELSDKDTFHVQINHVFREKTRNRKVIETEQITQNISLPLGWVNFSTEVENKVMIIKINSYNFTIEFEYPVRDIYICSKQMASCLKGTPTWKITAEGEVSHIPTVGLDMVHFSLYSNKSFSPILHMENMLIYLQYNSGVEIGPYNTTKPLLRGTYEFALKKERERWILYRKQ
ncbi:unnamed protein product, partial [Meganyctiphanes norvegica]